MSQSIIATQPKSKQKLTPRAIPHNSKCRYGERGAAAAKPKAQTILDAAKVSAASGGYSEPKQGQRSQSARGFCPRSTMRVPQPDIIEHFGNADAVPHTEPQRGASERNRRLRRLLARRSAGAVLEPSGGNCAVLPKPRPNKIRRMNIAFRSGIRYNELYIERPPAQTRSLP